MAVLGRGKLTLIYFLLSGGQLGAAIAIAVIVKSYLWNFTISFNFLNSVNDYECLLTYNGVNLCAYIYVVMSGSLVLSIFLLFMTIFAKRIWLGLEALMMAFGIIWWVPAAVTATIYGHRSDEAEIPQHGYRTTTWALCWVEVGLFTLTLMLTMWDCLRPRKKAPKAVLAIDPADEAMSESQLLQEADARFEHDKSSEGPAAQQAALLNPPAGSVDKV